jgi:UrcA family protein
MQPMNFRLAMLFVVTVAAVSPVFADDVNRAHRVVNHSDLDLGREDHAEEMLLRLERAARWVCGGDPRGQAYYDIAQRAIRERYEQCRIEALSSAVAELDSPEVARLFRIQEKTLVPVLADRD